MYLIIQYTFSFLMFSICFLCAESIQDTSVSLNVDEALSKSAQEYWDQDLQSLLHKARIAIKLQNYNLAEQFYIESLNRQMRDEERKKILLEMVSLYETTHIYSKISAIYEKYLELYPRDPSVTDIYLKLGALYREMGAPEKAIERYYNVLNTSIGIKNTQITTLQKATIQAQIQIAETYYEIGKYDEAKTFFSRLQKVDLDSSQRENSLFKTAYCYYNLKQYTQLLPMLQDFIQNYPKSHYVPEAYFILAHTYKSLNQPDNTIREVKNLLSVSQTAENGAIWLFWQKKTSNQIANEFYKQNDFMSALKVYQAMLALSKNADWQWPIIYQIGLCFEKLSMYPKAQNAYAVLLTPNDWDIKEDTLSEYLKSIQDMAKWRKDHLDWLIDSNKHIQEILKNPSKTT